MQKAIAIISVLNYFLNHLRIYHYLSGRTPCPHIHRSLPSQNPHKHKLHNVRVDEQELRPTVALRTCHGMHGAGAHGGVAGRVGEQDIFQ